MARLRSRSEYPPGQFCYTQAATGWSAIPGSFDSVVRQIIGHRMGNKAASQQFNLSVEYEIVSAELDEFNALRCLAAGWNGFVTEAPAVPFPRPAMPFKKLSAGVAGVRKVVAGIGAVKEWIGDGLKPVAHELAEHRASICTTRKVTDPKTGEEKIVPCPKNGDPNFLEKLSEEGAREIKTQMEIKADMACRTSHDDKLFCCKSCSCWLPLKLWAPLPYVISRLSAAVKQDLDPHCWILEEIKAEAAALK